MSKLSVDFLGELKQKVNWYIIFREHFADAIYEEFRDEFFNPLIENKGYMYEEETGCFNLIPVYY